MHRCEVSNITVDLKVIGINERSWIDSSQGRDYLDSSSEYAIEPLVSMV